MCGRRLNRSNVVAAAVAMAVLFTGISFAQKGKEPESKKKKLYISTMKANGVNAKLAGRVKEGIRLAIFEGFGAQYQVIDDDAIRVMYKQAEAIMASGCDDTSCITQIADGINADEIVYGDVSQDGAKIAVSATSLERKGTSLGTKSIVRISFLESQVDWASSETAKKLMNPGYKIDMSKAPEKSTEVKLGGLEVNAIKGLDISVISFKSEDETVSKIIDYSKGLVAEGDTFFNNHEYVKARAKYGEVAEKVRTKLSANKQSRIQEYVDGIYKRIASAVVMEYKPKIEKIDAELKGIKDPGEKDLENGIKKYLTVEEEIKEIPYPGASGQILAATADRKDSITVAIISMYEMSGDVYYRDYKFTEAMNYYTKGKQRSDKIVNTVKQAEVIARLDTKIDASRKTGEGYLVNRVKSLVDQAEFYNFQDKTPNAKSSMKEAGKLIGEDMKMFATMEAVGYYNGMAEVLKIGQLNAGTLPEVFSMINRRAAIEKKKADQERFKRTGVYRVGDTGPADGIIFYDKGSYSDGWRYLEAAPNDQSNGAPWGCIGSWDFSVGLLIGSYDTALGTGRKNTIAIINKCTETGIAARICADYRGGGKSDWYLPSQDELILMYRSLHKTEIVDFSPEPGVHNGYWSSTEYVHNNPANNVVIQNFITDDLRIANKYYKKRVRAIRAF